MGDKNPICTLGDYSKPSYEGYRNTIELLVWNNVVSLRFDTIRLVQNGCSFHGLQPEDPDQHLKLRDLNTEESWALLEDLDFYDNESWNDPRDFAKPVKAIALPQDVPMVLTTLSISWKIPNKPLLNTHPRIPVKREFQPNGSIPNRSFNNHPQSFNNQSKLEGLVSKFMASQDTRLSKFEADLKKQQSEMTNKIDTVLKAITDRIAGALPSDTFKNPKLSASLVLSARSYPNMDPQCSNHVQGSINAITIHSEKQSESYDKEARE
ncbi:hypothetical protein Tco_1420931 [Tanacetum coccineum]